MFNFDYITNQDIKGHNPKWTEIPDISWRILTGRGSGSRKTNSLLNLLNWEPDIDKIYLSAKYPYEAKFELLINKRKSTGLMYLNDWKSFIKCSNDMDDIYKNIEDYNPNKKQIILIVSDGMIAEMVSNKILNPIVTELFIRGGKLNISFAAPKNIRPNSRHYFLMKIPNERKLQ